MKNKNKEFEKRRSRSVMQHVYYTTMKRTILNEKERKGERRVRKLRILSMTSIIVVSINS